MLIIIIHDIILPSVDVSSLLVDSPNEKKNYTVRGEMIIERHNG